MVDRTKPDKQGPRRSALTRQRLLDAAEASFIEKGFHGSSVESIAAAAGHTTGAIYSHFRDKDGLFLAVTEVRFGRFYTDHLDHAKSSADLAAALASIVAQRDETYYLWGSASLEFSAYSMRNPRVYEQIQAMSRRTLDRLEQQFAPLAERCEIPARIFAQVVSAVLNIAAIMRLADDSIDEAGLASLILSRVISGAGSPTDERP